MANKKKVAISILIIPAAILTVYMGFNFFLKEKDVQTIPQENNTDENKEVFLTVNRDDIRNLPYVLFEPSNQEEITFDASAYDKETSYDTLSQYIVLELENKRFCILQKVSKDETCYYFADIHGDEIGRTIFLDKHLPSGKDTNTYPARRVLNLKMQGDGLSRSGDLCYTVRIEYEEPYEEVYKRYKDELSFLANSPLAGHVAVTTGGYYSYNEKQAPINYYSIQEKGAPKLLFSTKNLPHLNYISLDSLWNKYNMNRFEGNRESTFHILPQHFDNHTLMVQRIPHKPGPDQFLLRRINKNTGSLTEKPVLDFTSSRVNKAGIAIQTFCEVYEGNFILLYEEENRNGLKTRTITEYIFVPDERGGGEYSREQNTSVILARNPSFCSSMPEGKVVQDFLRWYAKDYNEINSELLINMGDDVPDEVPYKVDMEACERYIKKITDSGYFSDNFLNGMREYFKDAEEMYQQNPVVDGPPDMFDFDFFLLNHESDFAISHISNEEDRVIMVQQIDPEHSIVAVNLMAYSMIYHLVKKEGKWLISNFTYYEPYGKYYVTQGKGVFVMPFNQEQLQRMLDKRGITAEDEDYYSPVKSCKEVLESEGITVETLNDRYKKIVFPDGSSVNMEDIYLYDILIYDESGGKLVEYGCLNTHRIICP